MVEVGQAEGGERGGWKQVVDLEEGKEEKGGKEGGNDLWAVDEEEQGVFWLRVTSSVLEGGKEGGKEGEGAVRVLVTFE
jgi:hypothetical protein